MRSLWTLRFGTAQIGVALAGLGAAACGARTGLDDFGLGQDISHGGGGGGYALCQDAADVKAIDLGHTGSPSSFGAVASNGCSFAVAWSEGHSAFGATVQVEEGKWLASEPAVLFDGAVNSEMAIAWDGEAYTVAWANQFLFLRRMAENGAVLGPTVRSIPLPGSTFITAINWLEPAPDGSLRVGYTARDPSSLHDDAYEIYFARVTHEGMVVVPPAQLTMAAQRWGVPEAAGFTSDGTSDTLVWVEAGNPTDTLQVTTFDDGSGAPVNATMTLETPQGGLLSSGGNVVRAGGETYFSALYVPNVKASPAKVLVGQLTADGYSNITDVPGHTDGLLAARPDGMLGVVTGAYPANIVLTIVEQEVVRSSVVVEHGGAKGALSGSPELGVAAGVRAFGVLWGAVPGGAKFTIVTPQ